MKVYKEKHSVEDFSWLDRSYHTISEPSTEDIARWSTCNQRLCKSVNLSERMMTDIKRPTKTRVLVYLRLASRLNKSLISVCAMYHVHGSGPNGKKENFEVPLLRRKRKTIAVYDYEL